jgi:hypothetical protein
MAPGVRRWWPLLAVALCPLGGSGFMAPTPRIPDPVMGSVSCPPRLAGRCVGRDGDVPSAVTMWARRKKRDAADFERFDLDELRDEKRFEEVEEVDPELFRPSKMEYYVPAPEDIETWDVPDTR